jgi:uncharacterized delta-60 repeat protein
MKNLMYHYDFLSLRRFVSPRAKRAVRGRRWLILPVLLTTFFALVALTGKVWAADVLLDFTFGTGGIVRTDLSGNTDTLADLAFQPDGKIVATGFANAGGLGIARYNSNGTLDTGFGGSGFVISHLIPYGAKAVAVQPDGKIVAAGATYTAETLFDFALVRYNSNGTIDSDFGMGGGVRLDYGVNHFDYAEDVLIQPDGKIIAVGGSYAINNQAYFDITLARFNSNGTVDTNFGAGGRARADFGYGDYGYSALLLSDGKILVGGLSRNVGTLDDLTVVRFNSDGTLDTTFGTGGRAVAHVHGDDAIFDMALQADGKIVAAGYSNGGLSPLDMAVVRFNADGSLDSNFGVNGKQTTSFTSDSEERAYAVAIQADGKIVVGGYTRILGSPTHEDAAVARYNADGSHDASFDADGKAIINSLQMSGAAALLIQPDGKIILGAYTDDFDVPASQADFLLARLQTTARASAKPYDFDGDGKADIGVFRPANGSWYIRLSSNGSLSALQWGTSGDLPEPADFNGDSRNDFVVYRNGIWYITYFGNSNTQAMQFGTTGDIPVAADYDGDARADFAVFRPSNSIWYILRSSDNVLQAIQHGTSGDKPVPGDYNGDGRADVAVWRPSNGTWYTSTNPATNYDAVTWGQNGDTPAPGDYDGDGKNDRAIFRPSTATWWIYQSSDGGYLQQSFGVGTDMPVPADYDGDGRTNIAVFRPSTGVWYTSLDASTNYGAQPWGQTGDIPIESSNVP